MIALKVIIDFTVTFAEWNR